MAINGCKCLDYETKALIDAALISHMEKLKAEISHDEELMQLFDRVYRSKEKSSELERNLTFKDVGIQAKKVELELCEKLKLQIQSSPNCSGSLTMEAIDRKLNKGNS